jgi:hypothetical protein
MSVSISSASPVVNEMFANDPILSQMNNPNIAWGDLLLPKPVLPNVTTHALIEQHYPVIVRSRGIQWSMQKLAQWRASHTNPRDWKLYETSTAITMIRALSKSGWIVSEPKQPGFICTIHKSSAVPSAQKEEWVYEEPECPTMICLNDIKLFFPVIWHKLEQSNKCKKYSLELYNDKIRTAAAARGVHPDILTAHLSALLHTTLRQSPAWHVVDPVLNGEHSRLDML